MLWWNVTADRQVAHRHEVAHEDAGHPEVQPESRRNLSHRQRSYAERDNVAVLEGEPVDGRSSLPCGQNLGFEA